MKKLQVYFNEYNMLMGNAVYLPLVSGLLQAYANNITDINNNYQFMPFIFIRDLEDKILSAYDNPAVAAFSVSIWNTNLSLAVAREIKNEFPQSLIVFGGPSVPFDASEFMQLNPFVDIAVRGEGEQTFAEILLRFLDSRDFGDIAGVSYRDPLSGKCIKNKQGRQVAKNLDLFPSPYTNGCYDYLTTKKEIKYQAIIETNRGCPYRCSYCFWGHEGLEKKYRLFSINRVKGDIEWCAANKLEYLFCADSNFGFFKRDFDIAKCLVDVKKKYGYPERFRVCYAKNTEEDIYKIGKLLHTHNLEKGVTMSRQTNNPEASSNVRRKNIKMEMYKKFQNRFSSENIPVYTEFILGLPGETYQSFVAGIEEILQAGITNQMFIYFCRVFPNTELDSTECREKFKISTVSIPLNEVHATIRPSQAVTEYENIIVSTYSMPSEDWKKTAVFSWVTQMFYGLKIGFYIMLYLRDRYRLSCTEFVENMILKKIEISKMEFLKNEIDDLYEFADSVFQGGPLTTALPDFGNIYWELEEVLFLKIISRKDEFYRELYQLLCEYLESIEVNYNDAELVEVIEYQKARVPVYNSIEQKEYFFNYNVPEYFDKIFLEDKVELSLKPQNMVLDNVIDFKGDKEKFAREIVVYGRKINEILCKVNWKNQI